MVLAAALVVMSTPAAAVQDDVRTSGHAQGTGHAHHGQSTENAEQVEQADPQYGDGWRELPPIAGGPRQEHSVTALDGKVYVIGGIVPTAEGELTTVDRVEIYDTRTERWSEAAPLPIPLNHPNVAAVDGRIYVLGGLSGGDSWEALGDSFVYDPETDRWTTLASMPEEHQRGSAAMGTKDGSIYMAGGMRTLTPGPDGLQDTVNTVSAYDVDKGRWHSLDPLPQARDHAGGAIVGKTFFVLGGRDRGQVNVRDDVYGMDLRTGRWTEYAPMPTARGGIATAVVGTSVYTFGGEGNLEDSEYSLFSEVEAYHTAEDQWEQLDPMPVPRHGTAAVAVDDTIYIPGGGNAGGGAPVDVHDAYRPSPR